jgi:hypothetical protein
MNVCPKCGSELKSGSQFCHACGADINWREVEETTQSGFHGDQVSNNEVSWTINKEYSEQTNLVNRVKNILLDPKKEWQIILSELPDTKKIIFGYVCILALIPSISAILGYGFRGYWMTGVQQGLIQFLVSVISVLLIAWIVDLLAPSFFSEVNFGRSMQLVSYSLTPGMVAGILLLFPSLSPFVLLISLYSIYLLYTGVPLLKKTPNENVSGYVGITIVVIILLSLILAFTLAGIVAFVLFR